MATKYKPRIRKINGYWEVVGNCPPYRGKGEAWRRWSDAVAYCHFLDTGEWPEDK